MDPDESFTVNTKGRAGIMALLFKVVSECHLIREA